MHRALKTKETVGYGKRESGQNVHEVSPIDGRGVYGGKDLWRRCFNVKWKNEAVMKVMN